VQVRKRLTRSRLTLAASDSEAARVGTDSALPFNTRQGSRHSSPITYHRG